MSRCADLLTDDKIMGGLVTKTDGLPIPPDRWYNATALREVTERLTGSMQNMSEGDVPAVGNDMSFRSGGRPLEILNAALDFSTPDGAVKASVSAMQVRRVSPRTYTPACSPGYMYGG